MRLARVQHGSAVELVRVEGAQAHVVAQESDHVAADVLRESIHQGLDLGGSSSGSYPLAEATLLCPVVNPPKIVCIGLNYSDHAAESGRDAPERPLMFAKFANAITDPGAKVEFPSPELAEIDYEGELAVVIGRQARDVSVETALEYVLGYTVANDISARDAQFGDGQWLRGKSTDGFCPLGPTLVTADEIDDVQNLDLRTHLNGEEMQSGNTNDMIFSVPEIIAYASRYLTLVPGDVLLTGTPPGVGFARTPQVFLSSGDVIEVEVGGIGRLSNTIGTR